LFALAFAFLVLRSAADDQIKKKDGTVINGQVLSVSNGQVLVGSRTASGGTAKIPYYLSDIQSVTMAPPAAVASAQGAAPAAVIAALEPLVKQYAGLPADWVVGAMVQLAEAYSAANQSDRALALYVQIGQLYPGSAYENEAEAGKAKLSLQQGKIDDALAAVKPIVDAANKNLAPSPTEGGLYANAFLVDGQVLEAQKKPAQALEAYLTVKTMFYQNPALVQQAAQLAQKLRDQNPGLGID
jgi:tetratricopeptide (TPR) repeat protein